MKDSLRGNKKMRGSILIELVIAFGILLLVLSAAVLVGLTNQQFAVDTEMDAEALNLAHTMIERTRVDARGNYISVLSSTSRHSLENGDYVHSLQVSDLTECKKQATTSVLWNVGALRSREVTLSTLLIDRKSVLALGGDCDVGSPTSFWDNPQYFAGESLVQGVPTALDVLSHIVYLGSDNAPFVHIADTRNVTMGQTAGLIVPYTNGFTLGARPNDLDVIYHPSSRRTFLYVATHAPENQLRAIDMTNQNAPDLVALRSLAGVSSSGSYPQGRHVYVYDHHVYLSTWETAGPEFHVFDISNPVSPVEIGTGRELGVTVEDLVVRDLYISGNLRRIAFMATAKNDGEVMVYDVTDPLAISELSHLRQNLPGNQDGESVFISGATLYVGRASTPSGPDMYVYDVGNLDAGMTLLGSVDFGTGVLAIRVAGGIGMFVTSKVNEELQFWNIANPISMTPVSRYRLRSIPKSGFDYESGLVYVVGSSTPHMRIMHSVTP
jgi:hypothetical protein